MRLAPLSALSSLALEMYRACRTMPVDAYQNWALRRLAAHVSFDSALWASGAFNTAGDPIVHNLVLLNRPPELMQDYEKIKRFDLLARRNVENVGKACFENSVDENPAWSPKARAYLRKWRISHALSCITVDPLTRLSTAIALWRDPGSPPYREHDRTLFEQLVPHMVETYGINRIVHLERSIRPKAEAPYAGAVLDRLGRLQVASPAFQRLVVSEWPDWRGFELPQPIVALLGKGAGAHFLGDRVAVKATPMNDVFLVQARSKQTADSLSEREREVAGLVAKGLTRKEAAQRLGIAPATVRNHMSTVFTKLGISKQSELAAALRVLE